MRLHNISIIRCIIRNYVDITENVANEIIIIGIVIIATGLVINHNSFYSIDFINTITILSITLLLSIFFIENKIINVIFQI